MPLVYLPQVISLLVVVGAEQTKNKNKNLDVMLLIFPQFFVKSFYKSTSSSVPFLKKVLQALLKKFCLVHKK